MPQAWQRRKNKVYTTIPDRFCSGHAVKSVGGDFLEHIWKEIIKASVVGFVVPGLLLTLVVFSRGRAASAPAENTVPGESTTMPTSGSIPTTQPPTQPEPEITKRSVRVRMDDQILAMELESYVLGVVLAEVPSSFEPEALKAQAVAARTAALYICESGRHNGAVCANYGCCQAYISRDDYLAIGGTQQQLEKVALAVEETAGEVMVYQDSLACAAYFSCSGGKTEAAQAVWGSDVPYLQAVESPGEEFAPVYTDRFYFTPQELQDRLCASISGDARYWFGQVIYTDGGGVATMEIGGVAYRGTTLRTLLGLRSTAFSVYMEGDLICFETKGYGHRVGMSQYGAQAMALAGADYEAILCHYYQGASVMALSQK